MRATGEKRHVGAGFREAAAEVPAHAARTEDRDSHAVEYYVQFDRKDRMVRSHQRRDTRRMNTNAVESGTATGTSKAVPYVRHDVRNSGTAEAAPHVLNDLA